MKAINRLERIALNRVITGFNPETTDFKAVMIAREVTTRMVIRATGTTEISLVAEESFNLETINFNRVEDLRLKAKVLSLGQNKIRYASYRKCK